ncbi:unnamed protein product [Prorocentrum cordatum]|uniref:JmjC domain-containing protein n=1 Tax=Prorocentrum cordatum TaxID=2364126 RepID=A0ABN9UQ86_9DINO|nr:unnamed protein product [Polarella glacialis]
MFDHVVTAAMSRVLGRTLDTVCQCRLVLALCSICLPPLAAGIQGHAVREISAANASALMKGWPDIFVEGFPVVFRGLAAQSKLLQALSHDNLLRYADDIGGWSLNKGHGSGPWNSHAHEGGHWNLNQVLEYYKGLESSSSAGAALQCFKSQGHLPSLDLLQPVVEALPTRLLQTAYIDKVSWWMGVNGSLVVTGLHIDNHHNFFFATHGSGGKKFMMYPPWEADNLHVWPKVQWYSEVLLDLYAVANKTRADLEELWKNPSLQKYPNIAKADRYDVVLFPGDVLYIPMRWWHSGFNSGDVIGVNSWFYVPNPFANIFDQIFGQKPEDDLKQWPKLAKLPKRYASLKALPPPPKSPPMGVHPDMVRRRIEDRQRRIGCVRVRVRPFKKVFANLKQFDEELTCLRGFMHKIWADATHLISGDSPGGSAELWHKVYKFLDTGFTLSCPEGSPHEHVAAFERLFQLRHDRSIFSFAGLLENAYLGCAAKGTCLAVHQATGKALRSAVAWEKCRGGAHKLEL